MVNNTEKIMRKILLSAIALLALAFASCSKSELDPVKENKYTYTIKASINSFGTKTTMMGNTVNWEEGDQIALFANDGSKSLFTLSEGAGSSEGVFGTSDNIDGKTFVAALYPYNAEASYADGTISTTSAKEYNWAEGKNNKAIMAAKVSGTGNIVFKNAGAVIVLTVNNIPAGYNKIVLSSGVAVNGATTISFTDDIPTATMNADSDENKSVTINFEKSVAVTDRTFYFPVAITSEAAPFNVNLYDGTASKNLVSDKYTLVERNNRYYKTINFDSNGNPPTQAATSDEINELIRNGVTNFILDQNATAIEITEETVEQLQIAIGSTGDNFSISGEGAKGGIILCTPDNIKNLDVDTPNATVEVRPDAGVASFTTITAKTSENTFVVPAGTTVGQMIVKGGNVRVMGTVNIFTNSKGSIVKIYKEEGAVIPQELDANEFEVVDYASESFIKSKEELIAALAAASDGDVISLGKDIEDLTDILVIGKAITLDGQGHTITSSATRAINVSGVAGAVTIKNLNIIASGERAINVIQNSKNITIESVKAAASNYCVNVAASAPDATIAINGSDLTGLSTVNVSAPNTIVNIKDSRIFCNDKNSAENYGAITITLDAPGSKVTVEGGIIVVNDDSKGGSTTGGTIEFSNTTKGNTDILENCFAIRYNNTHYSFETLEEALEIHKNGETIIMVGNYTLPSPITIAADKEVVLDLNGCTLSQEKECTAHYEMIKNNGKLTITGKGTISFKDLGPGSYTHSNWGTYTIRNNGELIISLDDKDGKIEHLGPKEILDSGDPICYVIDNHTAGKVQINSGTISSPASRTLRNFYTDAIIEINGGSFIGQIWMQQGNAMGSGDYTTKIGSLTINGGNFSPAGADGSSVFITNHSADNVKLSVTGGTFNTKIGCNVATHSGVKGKITGGKFSESAKANTNANLFATGGTWSELVDGFYTFTTN